MILTFLNRSDAAKKINFDWKKNAFKDVDFGYEADFNKTTFKLKNLWTNKEAGNTKKNFTAELASHDCITLKLSL